MRNKEYLEDLTAREAHGGYEVPDNFGALPEFYSSYEKSKVVVLPVPYEFSTTYGGGTLNGPSAIIEASKNVELFDEELKKNIAGILSICTLKKLILKNKNPGKNIGEIYAKVKKLLEDGKFVVTLGGEHSISIGPVRAYSEKFKDLSILYFDAHGDLREEYNGSKYNHACALKRISEFNKNIVHVGCRSICDEEAELIEKEKYKFFWAHEFKRGLINYDEIISNLKENVYISFDADVLDSAIMPATGTPEPGGLDWYDLITIVRKVGQERNIVGFDLVELSPIKNFPAYDFTAAKLIYKTIGYALLKS